MKLTNHYGLPEAFARAVARDRQDYLATRGDADITVTQLIRPPRAVALEAQYWDDLSEDVSDRTWALFGSGIHKVLQEATPGIAEKRFSAIINGWKVSGKADLVHGKVPEIVDYKSTKTYSVANGPKLEWVQQLNALAYLADAEMIPVRNMCIIAFFTNWNEDDVGRQGYPPRQVMSYPIPWLGRETILRWMEGRVEAHRAARNAPDDASLPLCTPEERWMTPKRFAVRKAHQKRAMKVVDTHEEAKALAAEAEMADPEGSVLIETRGGVVRRCMKYCTAAPVCSQWRKDPQNPEHHTQ